MYVNLTLGVNRGRCKGMFKKTTVCEIVRLYSNISTKILSLKCAKILKAVSVEKTCGRKRSLNYVCVEVFEKTSALNVKKQTLLLVFSHTLVKESLY
jgi:hypothetical protein